MADCSDLICDVVGGVTDTVTGTGQAIAFAQDPFGSIFAALRNAAAGLAKDVLPAVTEATLPDLTLDWFVRAYAISFAAAILVAVLLLIVQVVKVARGLLAGRELLEAMALYFPAFLLGTMFGPVAGVLLVNFFHALSNSVIQWGVADSTDALTSKFTAMIEDTDPAALTGGVVIGCLLMLCMVLGLLLVVLMLIVQLVTLYFTGVLIPLSIVWIIDRDRRAFGMRLVQLWVGILAAHPLLFFLLGVTFNLVGGSITEFGSRPPLQSLVTLCVAVLSLFVASLSPVMLLKFAPIIPTGLGGSSGPQLGRGGSASSDSYGPRNLSDAGSRYDTFGGGSSSSSPMGSASSDAAPEMSTSGAGRLSDFAAARAAAPEPAMAGAGVGSGGVAAAGGAEAAGGAAASSGAAELAAAGAAESSTGVGAAIGIPTLVLAGTMAASKKAVEIGNGAIDQATAPMDDRGQA